jgi:hypothetical protein
MIDLLLSGPCWIVAQLIFVTILDLKLPHDMSKGSYVPGTRKTLHQLQHKMDEEELSLLSLGKLGREITGYV